VATCASRFWRREKETSSSCCPRSGAAQAISTPWRSASQAPATASFGRSRAASEEAAARSPGSICNVAAVIAQDDNGPAFVVGHAFGNRVARMLATDRPELVRAVALVAANIGKAPSPPRMRAAIRNSADPSLPHEERIKALQFAFFAPGNDPRPWLEGWHPEVLAAQRIAGDRTSREEDFAAGRAPILYLQPDHDPLAHVEDAEAYARQFGARVTVVVIERASHAVIAEQPEAVSAALIAYARGLWPR
jgi:pimeloyl-ACP methyl ester carboxylesterase